MLYALNAKGRTLLFSGDIQPKDYEMVERTAAIAFSQESGSDPFSCMNNLKEQLLNMGVSITLEKIEKVFRPNK